MIKKIRLGDLLVQNGVITDEQLQNALQEQKKTGQKLGRTFVDLGYVEEQKLLNLLSEQLNIDYVDLAQFPFDPELVKRLPEASARRFRAIVLQETDEHAYIGLADPTDIFAYDEIQRLLGKPIKLAVVREQDLLKLVDQVYRRTSDISSFAEELEQELETPDFDIAQLGIDEAGDNAPVVRLLRSLFEDAIQVRASDIHIEPDEHLLRIRQRIDGVLQEQVMKEHRVAAPLVSRLKLMAGLDISEKRLPQDGRFNIKVKNRSVDVRLSTMPVQFGESVVMRLLDQSAGMLNIDDLGMPQRVKERYLAQIHKPYGMVLITGPTGSGKTTTLYSGLKTLNTAEKKIITVEDPVEYRLSRANQVQINPKIDLSFARVLKAAMRQDPDIILVGEIRDHESAEIGLRAAMTGHLVMSSLHTNDAVTAAVRLIDIGAEPYLVASSLKAVFAQRLVRKICDSCKTPHELDPQERAWAVELMGEERVAEGTFAQGNGCSHCGNTGYSGRIGVFEMLEINRPMADALRRADVSDFAKAVHADPNFVSLAQAAMEYALVGKTSVHEVQRVAELADDALES